MGSEEGFELRFPYRPLHWVKGLETDYEFSFDHYHCLVRAEEPFLVVKIRPFSTEQDAQAFMPRLWSALAWMAVELRTGFIAEMTADSVTYAEDPEKAAENLSRSFNLPNIGPVHGLVDGNRPSAIPIDKAIRTIKFGEFRGTVTWSADKYITGFTRALNQVKDGRLYDDEKLRLVIGLLSDHQREIFLRSKFLTCMIALEALAKPLKKHEVAQQILDELNEKAIALISGYDKDSEEYHALESLQRELLHRRVASLRSSIRQLVLEGLKDFPEDELKARCKEVINAYDLRGELVHKGIISEDDLSQAHNSAYNTLIDLLKRRIGIV